jgi:cell division protein FtsZ
MQGAKGVIISITGGEDMRLMEVDEAANHIRELVDPDANIIWGSAFNNDLDGKIRVSVVATGIDADAAAMPAAPAKVFAFPGARASGMEAAKPAPKPVPEPVIIPVEQAAPPAPELTLQEEASEPEELTLDTPADDGEELMLGTGDMLASDEPAAEEEAPQAEAGGNRSWINGETSAPAAPRREGGTLFERMSNIARGAAKADMPEEETPARGARDPLDIPRFLNRQNNQ